MFEMHTWEKQEDETSKSFEAFVIYRNMGPGRAIEKVVKKLGKSKALLERWSSQNDWVKRAQAYDGYLELKARQGKEEQYLKDIEGYRERQKQMAITAIKSAMAFLKKANDRLKDLDLEDITPGALPSYFRAAAAVAEIALKNEAESLAVDELLRVLQDVK